MAAEKRDARERQKEKERERRKRDAARHGQTKMKHSKMGVSSCIYVGITLSLLLVLILAAYLMRENTPGIVGGLGLIDMILTIAGIRAGIKGRKERDKNYMTCVGGIAGNSFVLFCLIFIFAGGLM